MTILGKRTFYLPLLVAAVPVLFLASENAEEARMTEVASALILVMAGALLLTFLLRRIVREDAKAALTAAILLAVFFASGHVAELLDETKVAGISVGRQRYVLLMALLVSILGFWAVRRHRGNLQPVVRFAIAAALALTIFNAASFGLQTFSRSASRVAGDEVALGSLSQLNGGDSLLPDIYYIILDGYGRADVLRETHDFDNSDFIRFLTDRGFYVAEESRTNYSDTRASIPSSLNMRYLDDSDTDVVALVEDSEVMRLAKSAGSKIVHLDSGWFFTRDNPRADLDLSVDVAPIQSALLNDFTTTLLESTALGLLPQQFVGLERFYFALRAKTFNHNMETMARIPDIAEPTFVFNHSLVPHPPYVFDEEGRVLSSGLFELQGDVWQDVEAYVEQLRYVNATVSRVVDEILAQSPDEPIIIIQSDHGPASTGSVFDEEPSEQFIFERSGILNAYYLPAYCDQGLYPSITPVNSFRVIFDSCVGMDLGLIEDRSYVNGVLVRD